MDLYIDTSDFSKATFALVGKNSRKQGYKTDPHKSYEILGFLEKFLKTGKVKSTDIKKIVVNKGPGSFTGVRIGVVMAQALGFAWSVPVKALAKDRFKI